MKKEIADLIKRYRKRRGMSQKELAQGICAQGIISRIERGEMVPSTDIFFGLIKKLEIDMKQVEEIFAIHSTNHDVYSKEIKDYLKKIGLDFSNSKFLTNRGMSNYISILDEDTALYCFKLSS